MFYNEIGTQVHGAHDTVFLHLSRCTKRRMRLCLRNLATIVTPPTVGLVILHERDYNDFGSYSSK